MVLGSVGPASATTRGYQWAMARGVPPPDSRYVPVWKATTVNHHHFSKQEKSNAKTTHKTKK